MERIEGANVWSHSHGRVVTPTHVLHHSHTTTPRSPKVADNQHLKIVIASAGRRAHYVKWFKEALQKQRIRGEVIALDYRATSPTVGLADRSEERRVGKECICRGAGSAWRARVSQ